MKKRFFLVFSLLTLWVLSPAFSQIKIGYTSANQILPSMEEFKTVQSELESYSKLLEKQLTTQQEEFKVKMAAYQKEAQGLPPVIRQQREEELQNLQQKIYEFQQKAQSDLSQKEQKLLAPLYDKVQSAIDAVAKANDYTMVLNAYDAAGASNILYAKDETDITNLVLKELGLDPKPAVTGGETTPDGN